MLSVTASTQKSPHIHNFMYCFGLMKNVILNKMRNKRCKEQKIHVDLAKNYNIIVYTLN